MRPASQEHGQGHLVLTWMYPVDKTRISGGMSLTRRAYTRACQHTDRGHLRRRPPRFGRRGRDAEFARTSHRCAPREPKTRRRAGTVVNNIQRDTDAHVTRDGRDGSRGITTPGIKWQASWGIASSCCDERTDAQLSTVRRHGRGAHIGKSVFSLQAARTTSARALVHRARYSEERAAKRGADLVAQRADRRHGGQEPGEDARAVHHPAIDKDADPRKFHKINEMSEEPLDVPTTSAVRPPFEVFFRGSTHDGSLDRWGSRARARLVGISFSYPPPRGNLDDWTERRGKAVARCGARAQA